uniref:Putative ovule protein n=1 Tax=Solanum chacoense TaxID=4108 RepID=A0A0V0GUU4_SOLCH
MICGLRGTKTIDSFSNETFQLRVALMWTINDFPAYGSLSGWCTNGQFACPCCNISTQSKGLKHGKKFCFMGHRCFLIQGHKYRNDAKSFDGTKELRPAPSPISGSQVINQVKGIKFTLGQLSKKAKRGRRKTQ